MGKATEFEKLRTRRRIKRVFKRTTMLMIFAAMALSLFLIWSVAYQLDFSSRAQNFFSSLKPGGGFPVAVDDMNVEKLLPLGKDVAVVTTSGNYVYNSKGARLATFLNSYNIPVTYTAGGKLLTFDAGGNGLRVDNKSEELYQLTTEGKITAGAICETGAFAVADSERGSLGRVTVYNAQCEEMYRWTTGKCYLYQLAMDQNGEMFCAAGVQVVDGSLVSQLHFHHLNKEQEAGYVELPDELVLSLCWNNSGRLQVITDRSMRIYDKNGVEMAKADVPSDLTNFENSPGGYIYLASGDYRAAEGALVAAYDEKLQQTGTIRLGEKIFSMQHDSGRLLLLTDKQLYLADQNLSQLKPREGRGLFYVASVGNHLYGIAEEGLVYEGL